LTKAGDEAFVLLRNRRSPLGWETSPVRPTLSASSPIAEITAEARYVGFGPRLCENAKAINRDRTNYSFKTVLDARIASEVNFEFELKNIVLTVL
jgi:hypothetical protein